MKNGSSPQMKLDYAAPPTDLTPYITAYYLFENHEPEFFDLERADVAQVRYFLSGDGEILFPDGRSFESFPVSLFGPRMTASRISVRPGQRVFGFGVLPAGWAAATGLPAFKHINSVLDGGQLFGPRSEELRQRLSAMDNIQDMAVIASEMARLFYAQSEMVPHWFIRAVDAWLESRLTPGIEQLEETTGLSRRQIERLCKQLYGAPPKLLVRKYRALRTANAIARGKGDWQDFIDEGYYDQSHCIREIKEFIGITPNAVRSHVSRLTSMTFDRSNLMGHINNLSAQT
jgi:AraC-like DNA-binding protein